MDINKTLLQLTTFLHDKDYTLVESLWAKHTLGPILEKLQESKEPFAVEIIYLADKHRLNQAGASDSTRIRELKVWVRIKKSEVLCIRIGEAVHSWRKRVLPTPWPINLIKGTTVKEITAGLLWPGCT